MVVLSPRRLVGAAVLAATLALLLPYLRPRPMPRYTMTNLGASHTYIISNAVAVNNRGEAAGFVAAEGLEGGFSGTHQAVKFQNGKIISLFTSAEADDSTARGINALGEMTGSVYMPTGTQAFIYSGGKMHLLGAPAGINYSEGVAINDNGEVIISAVSLPTPQSSVVKRTFLYHRSKMTDIGTLPNSSACEAHSINTAGQVVGECHRTGTGTDTAIPFLYDSRHNTMIVLPTPKLSGIANHINDNGQIVGSASFGTSFHAALWSGGHLTDMRTLPGDMDSIAKGLNNRGEAVGLSFRDDTNPVRKFLQKQTGSRNFWQRYWRDAKLVQRAFVYHNGEMQDLNALISPSSDWVLEGANAVNDRGQIVGEGLHHGQKRAFLLTPVR